MERRINAGDREMINLKNRTLKGFFLHAIGTDLSSDPEDIVIDLDDVNISIELIQAGKRHQVYAGTAYPLVVDSMLQMKAYSYKDDAVNTATEEYMSSLPILLGNIDLAAGDELRIDISVASDAFAAGAGSSSYVGVEVMDTDAVQTRIPHIAVAAVNASETVMSETLGQMCERVSLVSKVSDAGYSNRVISDVQVYSEELNYRKDWYELFNRTRELSPEIEDNARKQDMLLLTENVKNGKIDINFYSTNVSANENFLVVRSYEVPAFVKNRANLKVDKKVNSQ